VSRAGVLAARAAFVGFVVAIAWASLLPPEEIPVGPAVSDKLMHAVGYALLGALAVGSGLRWPAAVALVVGIGFVLEVAQRMTGYRSFEWADLAADAAGALLGALLVTAAARWVARREIRPSS
jgi:VanZ family protein